MSNIPKSFIPLKDEGNIIAVYGSLKKKNKDGVPFGNHRTMINAEGEFIGEDYVEFKSITGRGYPLAKFETGTDKLLKVELYKVSREGVLNFLDRLEGHPTFYYRKDVTTVSGVDCTIYEIASDIQDDSESFREESDTGDFKYYNWL